MNERERLDVGVLEGCSGQQEQRAVSLTAEVLCTADVPGRLRDGSVQGHGNLLRGSNLVLWEAAEAF